jgi:hypothetical protein
MAYDEPGYRRHAADDADSGTNGTMAPYRTGSFSAPDYRGRRRETGDLSVGDFQEPASQPDPPHAERTRDRLGIHFGWEGVLLVAAAAIGYLLWRLEPAALARPALDTLLVTGAAIGLLTLGAGLSLRAGVPNLAVGPIAIAAGFQFAENGDRGIVSAGGQAVAVAVVGAVVIALLIVVAHVPGWAATLAAAFAVVTFNQLRTGPVTVQGAYDPASQAYYLYAGFAVLAVLGGALGAVGPIRRTLGRVRPVGDPAARPGVGAALPVIGALTLSSVLAVIAGILLAAVATGPLPPRTGLEWSGIALGTALLAGTSAFGRRGGIFGTLLAVTALTLFLDYAARRDLDIALFAIAGAVLAGGLVVTRLIEAYGSPRGGDPDWAAPLPADDTGTDWTPDPPETWSPAAAPAQPAGRLDRWDDDRWGTNSR